MTDESDEERPPPPPPPRGFLGRLLARLTAGSPRMKRLRLVGVLLLGFCWARLRAARRRLAAAGAEQVALSHCETAVLFALAHFIGMPNSIAAPDRIVQ